VEIGSPHCGKSVFRFHSVSTEDAELKERFTQISDTYHTSFTGKKYRPTEFSTFPSPTTTTATNLTYLFLLYLSYMKERKEKI